ncbi:winged helix-turn-helix domain-containing protein [Marimonas sp. MJW-29]|uniref:Winged helix-turn-helix domain-containing protein n=1 Tax=Sulfitobacter sediminis TaxID=3234186 RepID=A0ABV3RT26_9RHOB
MIILALMEFAFGDFVLDLNRGELRDARGPVSVEPRAFGLLVHMVEHQGRLIEKDELIASVWDGRIVSDAAISTAIKAARRAVGDDGSKPTWLKTLRGRGFRFDGEVRMTAPNEPKERKIKGDYSAPHPPGQETAASQASKTPSMAIFDRPAVLVVGFECPANNAPDSALALGLAQEVRLNLSHWRWFPVIGPEAVGYKTAADIDVLEKAQEFGAAYVLTGSVRSVREKVRVNATLSSTEEGNSIWSRHFDGDLENLFDFEEEVSRAIVAQIEPELSRANSQRLFQTRPNDLSAWQLLLAAGESQRRGGEGYGTLAANEEQKRLVTLALEKEPGMARAWVWLAKCYWRETIMGWAKDRDEALNASLNASPKAMEINPASWEARCYRAIGLLFGRHEFIESEFHARESVRLNPSDAQARHALGCVLENIGRTDEALEHLQAVFRLNPNHPNSAAVLGDITTCHILLGHDAEAVETAVRLVALAPNYSRGLQRAIAALSQAGEFERAQAAVNRLKTIQPDFNEDYARSTYPFKDPEVMESYVKSLEAAGAFSGRN